MPESPKEIKVATRIEPNIIQKKIKSSKAAIGTYETEGEVSEKVKAKLYKGIDLTKSIKKNARNEFLNYLSILSATPVINTREQHGEISLENLIGTEGVRLYKLARLEESQDTGHIQNCFLKSEIRVKGKKPAPGKENEKIVVWEGGPSGGGKTTAGKEFLQEIVGANDPDFDSSNAHEYKFISVDGSVEREHSQMRNLVLNIALLSGLSGISDLEAQSKLKGKAAIKMKKRISAAALASEDYHLIIPTTFSKIHKKWFVGVALNFLKYRHCRQVFCKITAPRKDDGSFDDKTMQQVIKKRTETRAFGFLDKEHRETLENAHDLLSYNGQFESKAPPSDVSYVAGTTGTDFAEAVFHFMFPKAKRLTLESNAYLDEGEVKYRERKKSKEEDIAVVLKDIARSSSALYPENEIFKRLQESTIDRNTIRSKIENSSKKEKESKDIIQPVFLSISQDAEKLDRLLSKKTLTEEEKLEGVFLVKLIEDGFEKLDLLYKMPEFKKFEVFKEKEAQEKEKFIAKKDKMFERILKKETPVQRILRENSMERYSVQEALKPSQKPLLTAFDITQKKGGMSAEELKMLRAVFDDLKDPDTFTNESVFLRDFSPNKGLILKGALLYLKYELQEKGAFFNRSQIARIERDLTALDYIDSQKAIDRFHQYAQGNSNIVPHAMRERIEDFKKPSAPTV